jgi:hypothetical protein
MRLDDEVPGFGWRRRVVSYWLLAVGHI